MFLSNAYHFVFIFNFEYICIKFLRFSNSNNTKLPGFWHDSNRTPINYLAQYCNAFDSVFPHLKVT